MDKDLQVEEAWEAVQMELAKMQIAVGREMVTKEVVMAAMD